MPGGDIVHAHVFNHSVVHGCLQLAVDLPLFLEPVPEEEDELAKHNHSKDAVQDNPPDHGVLLEFVSLSGQELLLKISKNIVVKAVANGWCHWEARADGIKDIGPLDVAPVGHLVNRETRVHEDADPELFKRVCLKQLVLGILVGWLVKVIVASCDGFVVDPKSLHLFEGTAKILDFAGIEVARAIKLKSEKVVENLLDGQLFVFFRRLFKH